MKKTFIVTLLMIMLVFSLPVFAFAGANIMTGKTNPSASGSFGLNANPAVLVDGNLSGSYMGMKSGNTLQYTISGVNIERVGIAASSAGSYKFYFYDSTNGNITLLGTANVTPTGAGNEATTTVSFMGVDIMIVEFQNGSDYTTEHRAYEITAYEMTPDTTPPADITLLSGTQTDTTVTLSWVNPTDSDLNGLKVYRNESPIATLSKTAISFTDTGLNALTSYTYRIAAVDATGNESSGKSLTVTTLATPDTTPPAAPTGLTAMAGDKEAFLSWNANTDDTTIYHIFKNGTYLNTVSHPVTTFTATGLTNDTAYTFKIAAVDGAGNVSEHSTEVTVTPKAAAVPLPPSGVKVTTSNQKVVITWNPVIPTPIAYRLYRNGVLLTETTATSYTDTTVVNGTTYTYEVTVVTAAGESPRTPAPATPSNTPDFAGQTIPFNVSDMIKTSINFLKLYSDWVLLVTGLIFAAVLYWIIDLYGLGMVKKTKDKEAQFHSVRVSRTREADGSRSDRATLERISGRRGKEFDTESSSKEWELYKDKTISKLERKQELRGDMVGGAAARGKFEVIEGKIKRRRG